MIVKMIAVMIMAVRADLVLYTGVHKSRASGGHCD